MGTPPANHTPHICRQCGAPFLNPKHPKRNTYCSRPCSFAARAAGKAMRAAIEGGMQERAVRRSKWQGRRCYECSAPLPAVANLEFCEACSSAKAHADHTAFLRRKWKLAQREAGPKPPRAFSCAECGSPCEASGHGMALARYCSRRCRRRASKRRQRQARKQAKAAMANGSIGQPAA